MVVRILTTIHVEMTAKFGRVKALQRISMIKKHASDLDLRLIILLVKSDTMKPTQIISVRDLQTK